MFTLQIIVGENTNNGKIIKLSFEAVKDSILSMEAPRPEDFGITEEKVSDYKEQNSALKKVFFYSSIVVGIFIAFYIVFFDTKFGNGEHDGDLLYTGIIFGIFIFAALVLIYWFYLVVCFISANETGRIIRFNRARRVWERG